MTQNTAIEYPRTASILALAGGIIITLSGVLFVAVSALVLPTSTTPTSTPLRTFRLLQSRASSQASSV